MSFSRLLFSAMLLPLISTAVCAQHSDVEFGYDSISTPTSLEIEVLDATTEGFAFFESEMEELDPGDLGNFSSDEPGFTTNHLENLLINEGDQVWLEALDASQHSSFGVGYVNYFNPNTELLEAAFRLSIEDNTASTSDLILNGASIESGPSLQFLGLGDIDGDLHDHVVVDLLDDATSPFGAYGVLFQMHSDLNPADGNFELSSDPFWIIWNHGMDEGDFDSRALPKFGAAVPEPGSASILMLAMVAAATRRRRN